MTNEPYRQAYETAAKELEALLKQQDVIEERILALRKTLNVLSTLCQQESGDSSFTDQAHARLMSIVESGLTDDIRTIMRVSKQPMTASEVREELNKLGGSLAEQSNPLATISAILNRMAVNGEVKETLKNGKKAWCAVKKQHVFARLAERKAR